MQTIVFDDHVFAELYNILEAYDSLASFSDSSCYEGVLVHSVMRQLNARFQSQLQILEPLLLSDQSGAKRHL